MLKNAIANLINYQDDAEFAIAAVQEAGYPPNMVARVLHVPTSRVREWISGLDQSSPGGVEEGSGTEVGTSRDTEPV